MRDNTTKLLESAYKNTDAVFTQPLDLGIKQHMLQRLQHAIEVVRKANTLDDVAMADGSELSHEGLTLQLWRPGRVYTSSTPTKHA